jgi:nucleotide-binding universal stress UspA family protein/predicted transcriptional regulator
MSQTVIVPVDGSELAEAALPWAVLLARSRDLSLVLVQVLTWPTTLWMSATDAYLSPATYEQIQTAEREEATDYLAGLRDRLAGEGVRVDTVIREGYAAEAILDLADEHGAATIVLATHGRGGVTRWLLGSVAEAVLAQATVPVLLVRAKDGQPLQPPALTRLLVPLDGSELAERALDLTKAVAPDGATVVLARVVVPVERLVPGAGAPGTYLDPSATEQAVAEAQAYLQRLAATLDPARFTVQAVVRTGRAADELLAVAHDAQATLLVLSTHGRTGPQRLLLGSVADEVVRRAETAVFLVSARALAARVASPYTVRDLMTRDVAAVSADEPMVSVLRKLLRRRVSGAPVLDDAGKLVGVVSAHDLLAWEQRLIDLLAKQPELSPDEYARRIATTTAGQLMTHPPVIIEESASLAAAIHLFADRKLRRLPVVRDGQLVGMLSRPDVLRALATQWEPADAAIPTPAAGA